MENISFIINKDTAAWVASQMGLYCISIPIVSLYHFLATISFICIFVLRMPVKYWGVEQIIQWHTIYWYFKFPMFNLHMTFEMASLNSHLVTRFI